MSEKEEDRFQSRKKDKIHKTKKKGVEQYWQIVL